MFKLTLSICRDRHQGYPVLQKLLDEFRRQWQSYPEIEIYPISWGEYRNELISMAIHKQAGDVSQIGAPLVSDLVTMNALRPFSSHELDQMGGEEVFAPTAWKSAQRMSNDQFYSIPWLADPRVILYWRDMLEKAGVDEKTAFQTPETITEALSRLQTSGVSKPWGITAGDKHRNVHTVSSWIWAAGGNFASEDGKQALFLEPEGLAGLKAYFSMIRFMGPESYTADYEVSNHLFAARKLAMVQGNVETALHIIDHATPGAQSQLAVALPFGVPIVGGSSLAVWSSSRNQQAAVDLVRFLTGKTAQAAYPGSIGLLPVRLDVLDQPPYTTDSILQVFSEALHRGRLFPITKLSGLLEEHLGNALVNIWTTLAADPSANLDTLITSNLTPVARRYNNWVE